MRHLKIILYGLTLQSSNKGCEALAYSFLALLDNTLEKKGLFADVYSVSYQPHGLPLNRDVSQFGRIRHTFLPNKKKNVACQINILRAIKRSDLCVDFTDGDSFSDIYGGSRFCWRTFEKTVALLLGRKFMLGPQTYGPYNANYAKKWATWVVKKADYIYSRDETSAQLLHTIAGRDVAVVTDIAMALPAVKTKMLPEKKLKIGINISGLLWNGGYTGGNEFALLVDYQLYIKQLVDWCTKIPNSEVYLIPHVICDADVANVENDLRICELVQKKYPQCKLVTEHQTPMHIKGYIAQMDVFTGARMHSTIAAFSSGVATIPFAYSKKFEGLFGSLSYPYVVDGRKCSTEEALKLTQKYMEDYQTLKKQVTISAADVEKKMQRFTDELSKIVDEVSV